MFSAPTRTDAAKTDPPVLTLTLTASAAVVPDVPVDVPAADPVGTVTQPVLPGTVAAIRGILRAAD